MLTEEEVMEVRKKAKDINELLKRLQDTPIPFNEHETWTELKNVLKDFQFEEVII